MEKIIKVYDSENYSKILPGFKVIQIHKLDSTAVNEISTHVPTVEDLNISDTLVCSFCKSSFDDTASQRQHYKSDWHRYNLKQNLRSLEPITEDGFDNLADDVSSISGSDSESEDTSEQSEKDSAAYAVNQGKIFFKNDEGKVVSMYRSLLHEKKDAPSTDEALIKIARQCSRNTYWTVLMLGGGHFAGAVYNGSEVLVHKTFHCYTVRAKQGGSQGARDNKSGGSHPKSAGASLRRYNEQSLIQHVGDILETWSAYIEKSHLIFYRAAGPYNRTVLFGGKNPILKKTDGRLRTIPFSTRRPTYTELQRVHEVLTSVEIYGSFDIIKAHFALQKQQQQQQQLTGESSPPARSARRDSPKNKNINRAKSRETKERPLPGAPDDVNTSSTDDEQQCFELGWENVELSLSELKEYGDTVPGHVRRSKRQQQAKRKKTPKKKDRVKKWQDNVKRELYTACSTGDLDLLKSVVAKTYEYVSEQGDKKQVTSEEQPQQPQHQQINGAERLVNMVLDEHGNTALHLAAIHNHAELIVWLMDNDATPCSKNDKHQTPYTVNADKSIRNVFRDFAQLNPNRYNYAKSQIPTALKTEEELAEKRKVQRKFKKEREKEKRKESDIKRKDQEEKDRFLHLSDREKRALAAERRLLAAQSSAVFVRCFLCAEDMSGKVPFEYSGNRFCTMDCLKAHRMKTPVVLS